MNKEIKRYIINGFETVAVSHFFNVYYKEMNTILKNLHTRLGFLCDYGGMTTLLIEGSKGKEGKEIINSYLTTCKDGGI